MNKPASARKRESFLFVPLLAWLVYVTAYLGRVNLSIIIPFLRIELAYSKTALGFLASGFFAAYAAGQAINGALGDRLPVRKFISLGLLITGLCNILFAVFRVFPLMLLLWTINGYSQSMLWGPLLRTISLAAPREKQRRMTFLMSTSPVIGYLLSYILAGRLAAFRGWGAAFWVPGILLLAAAGVWYLGLPETLRQSETKKAGLFQKSGFPPNSGAAFSGSEVLKKPRPALSLSRAKSLGGDFLAFIFQYKIFYFVLLGILVGIIKESFILWGPSIFTELYGLGYEKMLSVMSFMPLANLAFTVLGGFLITKYLWNERRAVLLFLSVNLVCTFMLWKAEACVFPHVILFYYGLVSSIYTVNIIMTGYLPFHYKQNGRVSAVAGMTDCSIYLGASIAGPFVGALAEKYGWNGIFGIILIVSGAALAAGFLIAIPLKLCRQSAGNG